MVVYLDDRWLCGFLSQNDALDSECIRVRVTAKNKCDRPSYTDSSVDFEERTCMKNELIESTTVLVAVDFLGNVNES